MLQIDLVPNKEYCSKKKTSARSNFLKAINITKECQKRNMVELNTNAQDLQID